MWGTSSSPESVSSIVSGYRFKSGREVTIMTNGDIVKGKMKQTEGKAQDTIGKATDSTEDRVKGNLKQAEGKIQEGFGKVKEAVKTAVDDVKTETRPRT